MVQVFRQSAGVDPGRADQLERSVGAAADRDVGGFNEADAGVESGFFQVAEIGRGIDPGEAGGVVPVAALPALAWRRR